MINKPKTLRAIHANRGVEAAYRKSMKEMIDTMHNSIEYWLSAQFKKTPPRMLDLVEMAEDAVSPSQHMRKRFKQIAQRWIDRFEEYAPIIAEAYVSRMFKATDSAFMQALKEAGWTVKFTMTPVMRDAFQASLTENVGLIRSIPEKYLQQVEGIVMRSYSVGMDLATMTKELKALYPISDRRAALIARDQSNKANAVVNRARQLELGLTEAIWMHSHAGKIPRPDHVAADGKRYKIAEGCLISGKHIQPGEEINCRCTSRPILPI